MRFFILTVLALTGYAIGKPLGLEKRYGKPTGNSTACAQVSSLSAAQSAATPTVPAKLAYDCITSVPLNKTAALALIDTARPYFEWQSTLAYLKDPPAEYVAKIQNGVDVFGELASIEAGVSNGSYTNEYEFGFAFYELLQSTHDGHFVYVPDSVGEIFNFGRTLPLVSVSDDGVSLPKVYAYPDVLASSFGNATFKPSDIVKIDGQKATTWLENWAQYGSLQDRDALYNNVFYELAIVSLGTTSAGMGTFTGGGRGRWVYPGDTTTLKFANGTHLTLHNFAKVLTNFTGVTDGESLYKLKFTYPQDTSFHNGEPSPTTTSSIISSASSTSSAAATSTAATTTPAPGYPSPIVRQINNLNGGYFLEGAGYEDVAVLNAASFVGTNDAEVSFQNTNREFIQKAKAAGKTKLIVDVSANGGGTILQGYDLFKQLFPTLEAFAAADRARAIEAEDLIGQKFSEVAGQVPRVLNTPNDTLLEIESDIVSSNLNYRTDEKPDGTPFTSWKEKFGPISEHGDNYTNLFRWNLSDVLTPLNSGGINITGYNGYYTNLTQPFAAENVIVMTDGYCASTCTIFSALMRDVAGVKYVAMGGRSRPGISQAIGGVKGTNDWPWDYIQYNVAVAYEYANASEQAYYNTTSLANYNSEIPFYRAAPATSYNVNYRDGIRKNDTTMTPLQFVYEAADCRIFWTAPMTVDISTAWKAVADSAWNGKNRCVAGSLGNATKPAGYRRAAEVATRSPSLHKRSSIKDYPLDLWTVDSDVPKGAGIMFT